MHKHGIYVSERPTSIGSPIVSQVSIPFVIGAAPVQSADRPAAPDVPVLCTSWQDAVEKLGYSDDWEKYNLCEFMYSHFVLYGRQPVVFCNLLDPSKMSTTVSAADKDVADRKVLLPIEAINDQTLVVKETSSGPALVKGEDYDAFYAEGSLIIELLEDGSAYDADSLNVAYKAVTPASVTTTIVAKGLELIENSLVSTGMVPDLIIAPGYSKDPVVAAAMATKCKITELFSAKALIDLDTANTPALRDAIELKEQLNLTDENQIVCWPMLSAGNRKFHLSTQLAGLMTQIDAENNDIPYESPSNKALKADSTILEDGTPVRLTHPQANMVEAAGIVTGLRFLNGFTAWGNYTACYPVNKDVKDYFISVSRMFDYIGNTLVHTFWSKLDKPMNPRTVNSIIDTCNIWLNGLVGSEYLLGARVEFNPEDNPTEDLIAGIIKVRIFITPPPPLKEVNFVLEYDVNAVASLFE